MADKLPYAIVSPERKLAEGEADMIVIPGMNGDFAAMPDHAPFLTTLRPGLVTVSGGAGDEAFFVTGGFAEVSPDGASILAEESVPKGELSREWLDEKVEAARASLEAAPDDAKMAANQRLSDLTNALETLV